MFKKNNKTFKPLKKIKDSKKSKLSEYAKLTLGSGHMRSAVMLPKGEDENEWMAVNTVDFFNEISLLYGTITEFCTGETCPEMNAGPRFVRMLQGLPAIASPCFVALFAASARLVVLLGLCSCVCRVPNVFLFFCFPLDPCVAATSTCGRMVLQ